MSKVVFLIFIVLLASAGGFGQGIGSTSSTKAAASESKSDTFLSIEGRFSIGLPEGFDSLDARNAEIFGWRSIDWFYRVGYVDKATNVEYSPTLKLESEKIAALLFDIFYMPEELRHSDSDRKNITFAGHKGIEIRIETASGGLCLIRVFWVKQRAYMLGALLFYDKRLESDTRRIFDSLKLIPLAQANALISKRIADATPKPLPQTPAVKKLTSDAHDANLKGKVKKVITETQYIEGAQKNTAKFRSEEIEYNQQANQLKKFFFSNGVPISVSVFGYIDGKRVSTSGRVDSVRVLTIRAAMQDEEQKRRDPRYDLKYVYVYNESGELSEESLFDNADELIWRTVFIRSGNQFEESLYGGRGSVKGLYRKSISKLDKNGNEIEKSTEHPNSSSGSIELTTTTYDEFDAKGNWTKKTTTVFQVTGDSKTLIKAYAEYRTITYYK
jgi:hypothetical protein